MTASKSVTRSSRPIGSDLAGSDLAKVDAYENTAEDYDEVPEVTAEQFARAVPHRDGKPLRGRPPLGARPKKALSLRLDAEVEERFRSSGPGWQVRMNDFLARNEAVLKMIVDVDDGMDDIEILLRQMRSGGLRPLLEPLEASIARVEHNLARDREVVRGLRQQLVWDAPPRTA